jgi:hypothetical protein
VSPAESAERLEVLVSKPIDLETRLELRDASGTTLGVFVPEHVLRDLIEERNRLRTQIAENERTARLNSTPPEQDRASAASIAAERDVYLGALYALTRKEFEIDPTELAEMENNGLTIEQLLAEVERLGGMKSPGAANGR